MPLSKSAKKEGKKASPPARAPRFGKVLLVEDDPILALSLEDALKDGGAKDVTVCSSMKATMDALEHTNFDAIVLDVHLADRDDGWALAELVTLLGAKPPRIVFSTGSPEDIPANIAEMGPVFEKPYDPAQLVEVLAGDQKKGLFERLRGAIR